MAIDIEEMVEVRLKNPEDFLKVRETLTRIGVASRKDQTLYQSCHILHKQRRYFIVHFKELFALDGKPTNFDDDDLKRRNTIVNLLAEWGLIELVDPDATKDNVAPISQIKVLSHKEKARANQFPRIDLRLATNQSIERVVAMSNNYWEDEDDDLDTETDTQMDGSDLLKKLRKAKRADEKRIKEDSHRLLLELADDLSFNEFFGFHQARVRPRLAEMQLSW